MTRLQPDDPRHGTVNGYGNHACRCDRCRTAHTTYLREGGRGSYKKDPCPLCGQPKSLVSTYCQACYYDLVASTHGTESRYKDCRCDLCREASRVARQRRRLAEHP